MLSVSHKLGMIFIHIPKTAGTSITEALGQLDPGLEPVSGGGHQPVWFAKSALPAVFGTYLKFAVIRNPWARAVSLFSYRKEILRSSRHAWPRHWPDRHLVETMSFRDVVLESRGQNPTVMETCPPRTVDEIAWLEPSCFAWINLDRRIAVDRVLRLETLERDFAALCEGLGVSSAALPHANRSEHDHYRTYYDDETREIVARRYAADIEAFGYTF